ncbi:hypothetical protein SEPCBS119000_002246 [Sporothrix epigloea]|uniref:Trafficking protein particle complex II-specific subunit 65 IgD3 domain-containing protein n=1 Tax=Sporothrix epigloea TaxID=1892477 RepID=A0ABP0DGV6_9PEZI
MATPPSQTPVPADIDADFLRGSYLVYAVPLATDGRLTDELALGARRGQPLQALVEGIEERESLLFDETVDVYLILRCPYRTESHLRSYLDRLTLHVEAQIVNSHAAGRDAKVPLVETIFSGTVENTHEPLIVLSDPETLEARRPDRKPAASDVEGNELQGAENDKEKNNDDEPIRQSYCVWKQPVFLARPRTRLHGPSVSFTAVASLTPATAAHAMLASNGSLLSYDSYDGSLQSTSSTGRTAGYLRSREPNGLNLLESFGGDPAMAGAWPRLSAQRVSRVAPAAAAMDASFQPRPLRGLKSIAFDIHPAVHTRVRFAKPNIAPANPAVVAMLEIDFTPFFECEAVLTSIRLALPAGEVTDLNITDGLALPLYCVARDHFTFLYRLAPREFDLGQPMAQQAHRHPHPQQGQQAGLYARDLDITIEVKILVQPGVCTPTLKMNWVTSLDFAGPLHPGFGQAPQQPPSIQRAHRPSQLSIDGMSSFTAPSVSRPDALPSLEAAARSTATALPAFGITMTFAAPEHKVYAGEVFVWTVFVGNRASQTPLTPTLPTSATLGGGVVLDQQSPAPRKLALFALPKRRRNDVRVLRPPSTAGGPRKSLLQTDGTPTEAVADAVLDENVVHAMQRSSLVDSTDVVCLSSADTRVGPLAPNACHVVELRFMALRAGVVSIEAVRVVDLASQEHVDVRELPTMIISEGQRESDGV